MILGRQIFWLILALQFHVIRDLLRHSKVIFEQRFLQTLATLTRKHFINTLIFYKKILSSFSSEGSFKKAHLFQVVPQLFFSFTLNISEIYVLYIPVLSNPCEKNLILYKTRKENEQTNDFCRREKHFRKFSC